MSIDNSEKLLIVTASGKDYSLPVSEVRGILSLHRSEISPVPFDTGKHIRGIFSYKGNVIGLLYCEGISAESDANGSEDLTAVLLAFGEKRFALLVDQAKAVTDNISDDGVIALDAQKLYVGDNND